MPTGFSPRHVRSPPVRIQGDVDVPGGPPPNQPSAGNTDEGPGGRPNPPASDRTESYRFEFWLGQRMSYRNRPRSAVFMRGRSLSEEVNAFRRKCPARVGPRLRCPRLRHCITQLLCLRPIQTWQSKECLQNVWRETLTPTGN